MNVRRPIGAAILAALFVAAGGPAQTPALAQANLDAGKSPAKLFAHGCGSCHGTPHELAEVRRDFLIQHYTTGPEQADLIAAYLDAVRNEPGRTPKPRRSPRAEIEVADVVSTGSIGVTPPEPASSEAAPEVAPTETVTAEAAPQPAPLDIDE